MAESILLTEDEKNLATEDGENILLESSSGGVGVMTVHGNVTGSCQDVGPLDYSPPPRGVYVQPYSPIFKPRITK